ncbi:Rieske (2Fe-2S) protein [Ekhidna sp.]|uniref:QcrA and Rieske domain-containing protein n=1 Tax=Ekhidna sp. TaxID=2608089 RepID=UPI0032990863
MKRTEFIRVCGTGCLGMMAGSMLLSSCAGTKYVTAPIKDSFLELDVSAFNDGDSVRKYVIVQNDQLQYPISVFRENATQYTALYMRCTHQGTELQVFGDRLQCPAHGSEFTKTGNVQNGPADANLRSFPVTSANNILKIDLS